MLLNSYFIIFKLVIIDLNKNKYIYIYTDLYLNEVFGLNVCKPVILAFNINSISSIDCNSRDVNINP